MLYSFRDSEPVYFIIQMRVNPFVAKGATQHIPDVHPEKNQAIMNWDRVEGQWKQRRGKAVRHWGKLMNDELAAIAGKYEELVGRLQEKYGIAREKAGGQIARYKDSVEQLKKSNGKLIELQRSMIKKEKLVRTRKEKSRKKKKAH
jgi:uncharacterized protein YjbJ (UPF0337 family)